MPAAAQDGRPVVWQPNPGPQTDLITCPFEEILYGGAKGGGKSDGIIGDWISHLSQDPTHKRWARGIVFRKAYPDLEQLIERSKEILPAAGGRYVEHKKTWLFKGGARLKFRFVESVKDAKKYQGHEYSFMAFDEVGDIGTPEVIDTLRGALRSSKGCRPRLLLTGNPQGEGHAWLCRRFIDPVEAYQVQEDTATLPGGQVIRWRRVFIPARLEDNPRLLEKDPGYDLRLRQMTAGKPWLYKALREGDWKVKAEVPGALWTQALIDDWRVFKAPALVKIVVSVDPSVGSGEEVESNAAGIVVAGMGEDRHRYVLADRTIKGRPRTWASEALKAYYAFGADLIVAEANNGGLMVQETIEALDDKPKITLINAARGKRTRAEPISAEYEKGLWHHVGTFSELEAQMCTWKPGMPSPDRMDALVWAGHELGGTVQGFGVRIA